jgi:hypothetical protein
MGLLEQFRLKSESGKWDGKLLIILLAHDNSVNPFGNVGNWENRLPPIPRFFKPTGNDGRIVKRLIET